MTDSVIPAGENWLTSTCTLNVVQELEQLDEVKHLAILICGKDRQYWAGHYGTKSSRISVTLRCLSPADAEGIAPHSKYVNNSENAHVFIGQFWSNLLPERSVGRCPFSRVSRN